MPDRENINSGKAKERLAQLASADVKARNADAVLVVSDAWMGVTTSTDKKTIERINEMGLPRAHALGLIKKTEALICKIQVRGSIEQANLVWHYDRDINDKITMGKRDVKRGYFEGRFSRFFEPETEAHA
jgi:hypothetical protein